MDSHELASEIHQFISLVRARITGPAATDNWQGDSAHEQMWQDTYGGLNLRTRVPRSMAADLAEEVGTLLGDKLNAASVVVIVLMNRLGADVDAAAMLQMLDEVEAAFPVDQ